MSTLERDDRGSGESPDVVDERPVDADRGGDIVAFRTPRPTEPTTHHPERPLREVIGGVLRDERRSQQRTLADVAENAYVSLPYLSEVERGRKEPSSDVLASICVSLEIPLADVLERSADRLRARMQCHAGIQLLAA